MEPRLKAALAWFRTVAVSGLVMLLAWFFAGELFVGPSFGLPKAYAFMSLLGATTAELFGLALAPNKRVASILFPVLLYAPLLVLAVIDREAGQLGALIAAVAGAALGVAIAFRRARTAEA